MKLILILYKAAQVIIISNANLYFLLFSGACLCVEYGDCNAMPWIVQTLYSKLQILQKNAQFRLTATLISP